MRFHYRNADELCAHAEELNLDLPWSDDLSTLFAPLEANGIYLPNKLVVHPMEGFDADPNGEPSDLTFRRYARYASGGAGLIWFEATAIVSEGRSNPHQLYLHRGSRDAFARLVEETRRAARSDSGIDPVLVLQLTHSGRWSRPGEKRTPKIAFHSEPLDSVSGVDGNLSTITDDELADLMEDYEKAAMLAAQAGFDGVDIKACHGYLVSELLAGFTREGEFGGSFPNRIRFLSEVLHRVKDRLPSTFVTSRTNIFDGLPFPFGFGVAEDGSKTPDLKEPIELLRELLRCGAPLANVSIGVPYLRPHLGRPFDKPIRGAPPSPEHPLKGVTRLIELAKKVQLAVPDLPLVGTGYSWLRQYFPQVAAGAISSGWVGLIGVGRMAFAYPNFANDLKNHGALNPKKCCIACSGCTELMRAGGPTGCVLKDRDHYRIPPSNDKRKDR